MSTDNKKPSKNEGEGSSSAARHYDDKATEFAHSGKVDPAAKQAREAVESDAEELARAEAAGKRRMAEEDPEVTLGKK